MIVFVVFQPFLNDVVKFLNNILFDFESTPVFHANCHRDSFRSVNIFVYGPCIYSDCFGFSVYSRKTVYGDFLRCTLYRHKFKSEIVLRTFVGKII